MDRLRQYSEVRAANCRKPCFTAPFWKGDRLAQPLLPSGQFLRQRLAGWSSDASGESLPATLTKPALPLVSLHLPFLPSLPKRPLRDVHTQPARPALQKAAPNVPAPACAPPRPPVGLFRPRRAAGSARLRSAPLDPAPPPHTSADARGAGEGKGREAGLGCRSDAAARTQASPLPGLLSHAGRRAGAHAE